MVSVPAASNTRRGGMAPSPARLRSTSQKAPGCSRGEEWPSRLGNMNAWLGHSASLGQQPVTVHTVGTTFPYKLPPTREQMAVREQPLLLCRRLSTGAWEQHRSWWWGGGQGKRATPAQQQQEAIAAGRAAADGAGAGAPM